MVLACHDARGAERARRIRHPRAVRGDHDGVEQTEVHDASPDPLDERPAGDDVQRFVGKALRRQPGRDDAEDSGSQGARSRGSRVGACNNHAMQDSAARRYSQRRRCRELQCVGLGKMRACGSETYDVVTLGARGASVL